MQNCGGAISRKHPPLPPQKWLWKIT
jgi:hypothetical protein